jgi:hypothetical protein
MRNDTSFDDWSDLQRLGSDRRQDCAGADFLRGLREPVPEALASQWTWRSAPRTCPLLRRRDFVVLGRAHAEEALTWTKAVMTKG